MHGRTDRRGDAAGAVFRGLTPRTIPATYEARSAARRLKTVPIVLASTVAVGATIGGAVPVPDDRTPPRLQVRSDPEHRPDPVTIWRSVVRPAAPDATSASPGVLSVAATVVVPMSYRVVAGDTVSGIAGRFGLSTATVLALNGLSRRSVIHPGQVLKLDRSAPTSTSSALAPASSATPTTTASSWTVQRGDTISGIAARFRVSVQSVLDANRLTWSSIIYPGQTLRIAGRNEFQTVANVTPLPAPKQTAPAASPAPVAPVAPSPTPTVAPAATPASAAVSTTYTIRSGDTLSSIASRFGIPLQSLLSANRMTLSSVIYAGRSIVVPGIAAPAQGGIVPLTTEMAANARSIVAVGRSLGVPEQGLVIALSAAMQESSLRNLSYGDRDSVGLFQQRPSAGWGTKDQLMDPARAAALFFGGPSNPNAPRTRGLLDIPGWRGMTVTQAAQAVQISAFPDAYAKWEASARSWLPQL